MVFVIPTLNCIAMFVQAFPTCFVLPNAIQYVNRLGDRRAPESRQPMVHEEDGQEDRVQEGEGGQQGDEGGPVLGMYTLYSTGVHMYRY